jgi:hypothetical protein
MPNRTRHTFRAIDLVARVAGAALLAGSAGGLAGAAGAQEVSAPPDRSFEVRPLVGAFIPTGDQRDALSDAVLVGVQASYRFLKPLAITGTLAWSPSEDRIARGDESVDVFQYDVGVEGRAAAWLRGAGWEFTPFAGLGVGGRTYNYRDLDVDATSNVAGYGALGGEVAFARVGVRVEGRDYLSRFEPLAGGGDADTRNDVTVTAGLTVRF